MLFLLDIDGVMLPAKSWVIPETLIDGFPKFSNDSVRIFNMMFSPNDTIALTTSHKGKYTISEWKDIFKRRGIDVNNIQSLPVNINNLNRKDEILIWLNDNDIIEDFLILDDDKTLNELPIKIKDRLIQTSSYVGLTKIHYELFLNKNYNKRL